MSTANTELLQQLNDLEGIVGIVKEYSEKISRVIQAEPISPRLKKLNQAWWGSGIATFVLLPTLSTKTIDGTAKLALSWIIFICLLAFISLTLYSLYSEVKAMRRPLDEHFTRLTDRLPHEKDIIIQLTAFPMNSLELAEQRLEKESRRITAYISSLTGNIIGTTALGVIVALGTWLIQRLTPLLNDWVLTFAGMVICSGIVGITIGIFSAQYGSNRALYYIDLVRFAIWLKQDTDRKASRDDYTS